MKTLPSSTLPLEIHTRQKYGFRNFQHVIFKKHLNWNGFLLVTIPAHDCHVRGPRREDDFCDWLTSWVPAFAFFVKPRMIGKTATRSAAGIWIMIKCTTYLFYFSNLDPWSFSIVAESMQKDRLKARPVVVFEWDFGWIHTHYPIFQVFFGKRLFHLRDRERKPMNGLVASSRGRSSLLQGRRSPYCHHFLLFA